MWPSSTPYHRNTLVGEQFCGLHPPLTTETHLWVNSSVAFIHPLPQKHTGRRRVLWPCPTPYHRKTPEGEEFCGFNPHLTKETHRHLLPQKHTGISYHRNTPAPLTTETHRHLLPQKHTCRRTVLWPSPALNCHRNTPAGEQFYGLHPSLTIETHLQASGTGQVWQMDTAEHCRRVKLVRSAEGVVKYQ